MRELMLKRIEEIRNKENGFSKSLMKWNNFSTGIIKKHISDLNFARKQKTCLLSSITDVYYNKLFEIKIN